MMAAISTGSGARLVLIEGTGDDDSREPRIAILPPEPRAVPIAFRTMSAALDALRSLEPGR